MATIREMDSGSSCKNLGAIRRSDRLLLPFLAAVVACREPARYGVPISLPPAGGARTAATPAFSPRSSSRALPKRLYGSRVHWLAGAIIPALMHRIPLELRS